MQNIFLLKTVVVIILIMFLIFSGCDMFTEDIPPEKLPPVPEKCISLSNQYTQALLVARTSVQVSQLQITRLANTFAECLQTSGLSKAEAKGIIKNIEMTTRQKVDKDKGQDVFIYQ